MSEPKGREATAASSSSSKKRAAPPGFKLIEEGSASMLFSEGNEVFYNKVQVRRTGEVAATPKQQPRLDGDGVRHSAS